MTWNKVIERAKQEVTFRQGKGAAHNHTQQDAIILNIVMIVNDDGTPTVWTMESKQINPRNQAMDLLKALLT